MENRKYHVYTLTCPTDGIVRYVGCTMNPAIRYRAHLNTLYETRNKKVQWVQKLKSMNIKPIMDVVHVANTIEDAAMLEAKVFSQHNKGNLLCRNPRQLKYVEIKQRPRLTHKNKKVLSPIVAENVKKLMHNNGVSSTELSEKLHVDRHELSDMLDNRIAFNPNLAQYICIYFSADQTELITKGQDFPITKEPFLRSKNYYMH